MSDNPQDEAPQPQGNMDPNLEAFRQTFTQPEAQDWADEATTRLNDYYMQKSIAAENDAAANALVTNLGDFKKGLTDFVTRDPMAVHTALDLVPPTIAAHINAHPDHPDDQRQPAHDAITGDIQNQVARAAVISAAEKHEGMARGLMDDSRIAGLFDDNEADQLHSYINMQEFARGADAQAQIAQQAKTAMYSRAGATMGHASGLYDPNTDSPAFPQQWASKLMADPTTTPQDKNDLMHLYGRLQVNGDVQRSDPFLAANAISQAANGNPMSHSDIIGAAGQNLKLADALWLGGHSTQPMSVGAQSYMGQVDAHVQAARDAYLSEPSVAGANAFGKFMDWFLPRARGGADLNPQSKEYALGAEPQTVLAQFRPTGDDVLGRVNGKVDGWNRFHIWMPDNAQMNRVAAPNPPGEDEVIPTPRSPPIPMPTIKDVNPGSQLGVPDGGWNKQEPKGIIGPARDGAPPLRLSLGEIFGGRRA